MRNFFFCLFALTLVAEQELKSPPAESSAEEKQESPDEPAAQPQPETLPVETEGKEEEEGPGGPWFTSSLIAPRGTAQTLSPFELNSYVFFTVYSGNYNEDWKRESTPNFYSFNPQWLAYIRLTEWMDLNLIPQISVNWTEGQKAIGFNDFIAALDIQLYPADAEGWFPGVKITVKEQFPTGKYQNLTPRKLFTDQTGYGSFITYFDLVFYKQYHLSGSHYMTVNLSGEYGIPSSVHVRNLNAYGGGEGCRGTVRPGNSFLAIASFEFNFTQNWAFALDNVWTVSNSDHFRGNPGLDDEGNEFPIGNPSSANLSFTPAIEYNVTETMGLIVGCWFSVLGRNSSEFQSASMNFYFDY